MATVTSGPRWISSSLKDRGVVCMSASCRSQCGIASKTSFAGILTADSPNISSRSPLSDLLALDYLHKECRLVHTKIKADNILQELVDHSVLDAFTIRDGNPVGAEICQRSPCLHVKAVRATKEIRRRCAK